MTAIEAFALAADHHQAGRVETAEQIYRQILEVDTSNPDVWHLYGVACHQLGRNLDAVDAIRRAISMKGSDYGFHHNLGEAYRALGMNAEATSSYRRALELNPQCAHASNALKLMSQQTVAPPKAAPHAAPQQQFIAAPAMPPPPAASPMAAAFGAPAAPTADVWGEVFKQPATSSPIPVVDPVSKAKPGPNVAKQKSVDALNKQGLAFAAETRFDAAIQCYRSALAMDPKVAKVHYNLGLAQHMLGQRQEAAASYRRAAECQPDLFEAHNNLGYVLDELGRHADAAAAYRRATELRPNDVNLWNSLGACLRAAGKAGEAADCFRRSLTMQPDDLNATLGLGVSLCEAGRFDDAIALYQAARDKHPRDVGVVNALGGALHGRGSHEEAAAAFRAAIALDANNFDAHVNLATALYELGQRDEATKHYRRALELNPNSAIAHNGLGAVVRAMGKDDEAIDCFRRAIALAPDLADAHFNLGNALDVRGQLTEAIASYRKAYEANPNLPVALGNLVHELQHVCDWRDVADLSKRMIDIVEKSDTVTRPFTPFTFLSLPTTAAQQLKCARQWAAWHCPPVAAVPRAPRQSSKLTVGYLSADFRSHAVASLIGDLIESHDRSRFQIVGYSLGKDDGSPLRQRLEKAFDRFVDLSDLSHDAAARRIAGDGVDILVDLMGYTVGARTPILSRRPAPIQVNYLGYPGTTGASFIDYILVDDVIVPAAEQANFSERLVHLPGCYQVNDRKRERPAAPKSRQEYGLPETGVVFCCFNAGYKITPAIFDVWMRLLNATPGSVLWLLESSAMMPNNLRAEAMARGIQPNRLVFAPREPAPEYLARYAVADLFLDTFPYGAHTVAGDALWAGCPIVTLPGSTFASRVGASVLTAVGLGEWTARDLKDYESLALTLARDPKRLAELRAHLAGIRDHAPVFDGSAFARGIERAFEAMWQHHQAGGPPKAFRV